MKLSKLPIAASGGPLILAALVLAPVGTSGQSTPLEPVHSQQGPSLEGLLRPSRPGAGRQSGTSGTPLEARPSLPTDVHELEEHYRLRLSLADLDAREAAFDEVTSEASQRPVSREALEAISRDLGDPDLAFTARLALRETDARAQASARGLFAPPRRAVSVDAFEAMQQRMEQMLERDLFAHDFFSGDPFAGDPIFSRGGNSLFRRSPGVFGSGGAAAVDPFEAMRQRTEAIRKQFEKLKSSHPSLESLTDPTGTGSGGKAFTSSMSVQSTPDGVRVEITENDGSGPTTRAYEAPSMEALLEANPELKGRVR